MRRKVFRYSFLCALLFVFVTAVFMFTACGKEETVKEKEENKKENKKENKEEIVIKKMILKIQKKSDHPIRN